MTASKPKRSLVSATTALKLKRRRDACASTATRRHICKVGNFIAGRQVCCGKQVDHEGNFATNCVLAKGVNSPRTTDLTRTARSPRGQICRGWQIRQGRNFTLWRGLIRRETSPRTATLQRRVIRWPTGVVLANVVPIGECDVAKLGTVTKKMTLPQRGANLRGQPLPRLTQLCQNGDFAKKGDFSVAGNLVGEANFLEDNFVTSNLRQD